jgi:hypothetical protein
MRDEVLGAVPADRVQELVAQGVHGVICERPAAELLGGAPAEGLGVWGRGWRPGGGDVVGLDADAAQKVGISKILSKFLHADFLT